MTRAQIRIHSALQGLDFLYGISSDGYPTSIIPDLEEFSGNLEQLTDKLYMTVDVPGNPSYYYDLDCDKGIITSWEAKVCAYWVNAPKNWKERGYHCWRGNNERFGYTNWRKGKKLEERHIPPVSIQIHTNNQYNKKALIAFPKMVSYGKWTLKKMIKKGIDTLHTYISGDRNLYNVMYTIPYRDIPLGFNETLHEDVLKWRLYVGA